MRIELLRLGLLLLGNRLAVAAVRGQRVDAFVVEAENPADALRAELDQRGLNPRAVALALPRAGVSVKPIDLPAVDGEIGQMVAFELERHVPFPVEDAVFDFLPLPAPPLAAGGRPAPGDRQVVITAADRRTVDGALRVAEGLRLRPLSLTVGVHNLPALIPRRAGGRIVWVHGVGETIELLFLQNRTIVLSRSLPAGNPVALVGEIRRSFSVTRWTEAEAVWVSGDLPAELPAALQELGVPVTDPPCTPRARRLLDAIEETPRGALELALATAIGGRWRPFELLPPALRPRRLTRTQLVTAGLAATTVVLAIAALLAPGVRDSRRLADIDRRIAQMDAEVRAAEAVLQELERKRRLLATIESVETNSVRPLPVLLELTELLPNDAWLTLVSLDTKGVELTGQAAAAATLIPVLENSGRLERVEFASPVTRGRDREQFRIRAAWEGGTPAVALSVGQAPVPAASGPNMLAPPGNGGGQARGLRQPPRPLDVGPAEDGEE